MKELVEEFITKVSNRSLFQAKYLKHWEISQVERNDLNCFLNFFIEILHYDMEFIVESYLFVNRMISEETLYFVKNGKYRYSSFKEVEHLVYGNPEYMGKYMTGVSISEYIWVPHMKMIRYFSQKLSEWKGNYLEIGPGGGQYLIKAIQSGRFQKFSACDVSKTSVERSNQYLNYMGVGDFCTVVQKNFFDYSLDEKYDCVVMGEVLEHVEQPLQMMRKINELLTDNGNAFVTTVINGPTIDHIYLFENREAILTLAKEAGFDVLDYICVTPGDISLEKAIRKNMAIDIAMVMKRKTMT